MSDAEVVSSKQSSCYQRTNLYLQALCGTVEAIKLCTLLHAPTESHRDKFYKQIYQKDSKLFCFWAKIGKAYGSKILLK